MTVNLSSRFLLQRWGRGWTCLPFSQMALWLSGMADQREAGKTVDEKEDLRNTVLKPRSSQRCLFLLEVLLAPTRHSDCAQSGLEKAETGECHGLADVCLPSSPSSFSVPGCQRDRRVRGSFKISFSSINKFTLIIHLAKIIEYVVAMDSMLLTSESAMSPAFGDYLFN